jgi:phage FluMu protein gp41
VRLEAGFAVRFGIGEAATREVLIMVLSTRDEVEAELYASRILASNRTVFGALNVLKWSLQIGAASQSRPNVDSLLGNASRSGEKNTT